MLSRRGPFTTEQARDWGLDGPTLTRLVHAGEVRRILRSVYVDSETTDSLPLRIEALRLMVPSNAVVVDETAAWVHGAELLLAPTTSYEPPPVRIFQTTPGSRLRSGLVSSGERRLLRRDVVKIGELWVTTPLRTACDLGRLQNRDRALGCLDGLLRLERFDHDELIGEIPRFRGARGVRQLRVLAPLADPRAESPPESALRLRWLDTGLPTPTPQLPVAGPGGVTWHLDLGLEKERFAAEYDGEQFHSDPLDVAHDEGRRGYLEKDGGWVFVVARRKHIYGQHQDIEFRLRSAYRETLTRRQLEGNGGSAR